MIDTVEAEAGRADGPAIEPTTLAEIVRMPDPELANRRITEAHHELAGMLAAVLGPDAGANFHTWAVWGSREAGRTIARHDVVGLTWWTGAATALTGAAVGYGLGLAPAALAAAGATAAALTTRARLGRARTHISHGNRIVLDEIGGATLAFLAALDRDRGTPGPSVATFLAAFAPGPTAAGGQDLLRRSFAAYDASITAEDDSTRHQLVFAANCFAVRHEHLRLQRDISRAMPRPLRRLITRRLLDFWVGPEHLHVGRDLAERGGDAFPPTLRTLTVGEAVAADVALRRARRPTDTLAGSGATDWTVLDDRMNYVVDLFRSRHLAPEVAAPPYPASPYPASPYPVSPGPDGSAALQSPASGLRRSRLRSP